MKYIPATGNDKAKILVLGEAPSYQEVEAGKPFVGPSGKELDRLFSDVGIRRENVWISNVSKYMVPPNLDKKKIPFHVRATQAGIDIDEQIRDLQTEINQVKPNVILALGGSALWALTGSYKITDYRGSILFGMGRKVVPTFHPAHLLHMATGGEFKGYWNRQVMILDMKRALAQSEFSEVLRPSRNLQICRSSSQLADFRDRYRKFKRPAVDIEARGSCIPFCVGLAFTPHEGLTVPLWNKGEIESIVSISDSDMVNMWIILAEMLHSDIVGQNFKYDQDKIRRLGFIIRCLGSDTLLKSFTISPELPKNLAFNTSIRTEEPFYKNEGMYEGKLEDLLIGCARDSCVTKEIDLHMDGDIDELGLRDFYEKFILPLHGLYLNIENEGFVVNPETKERLLEKYVAWSERLSYELFTLTNEYVNVNSPKQVYTLLFEVLKFPKRHGTGEEEITALLNNQGRTGVHTAEGRRILEIILEKRRVDKTIGNYLMALPDYDGKMKTSYFLCLETGRTSTHQLEPPIRPSIEYRDSENKKKHKNIGTAFQTMTKHGDIGEDVRSIYEPSPGYVFLQADSAQAEARVVFKLADDEQALKDIDTHDYHALTASWFFGGSEDDYSKKKLGYESPIRFAGKAQPLYAKVLTPNGWKFMKDIKVGDEICNTQYGTNKVTGVFPQGVKKVFRFKLSDGAEVESCSEHLWPSQVIFERQRNYYSIRTTEEISKLNLFNTRGNPKYSILMNNAMWFNSQNVPFDPYLLGVLIGDGSFTTPYHCSFFSDDREIVDEFINKLGYDNLGNPSERTYNVKGVRKILDELDLGGRSSEAKFIPDIYKINSLEIRLEILRGLMDTDGTINEFGSSIEYSTSSEKLANDVIDLVRSLGGIANCTNRIPKYRYKDEIREGKRSYRIFISIKQLNPFKLRRKAERWERWYSKTKYNIARNIVFVEEVWETECQCISVDSEDHCYITDNFIITHNTLRHAGHLGAGKRRAATSVNTDARKYKIPIQITEQQAERALKIFHMKQPKIQGVFQKGVVNALERDKRYLTAGLPYGIDSKIGGKRLFFERWGEELFRQAFSYIPQRSISDNTKAAALRLVKNEARAFEERLITIIMESHDALLFMVRENWVDEFGALIRAEMERPISFETCSIPRSSLIVPCELEIGYNYQELKKFKSLPLVAAPRIIPEMTMTEKFYQGISQ